MVLHCTVEMNKVRRAQRRQIFNITFIICSGYGNHFHHAWLAIRRVGIVAGFTLFVLNGLYSLSYATEPLILPLGIITDVQSSSCASPNGAVPGAACFQAVVHCPNTDDINVAWAVRQVINPSGFITLSGSDPSSEYFGGPDAIGPFAVQYNTDGFSTAQIAWVDSNKDASNYLNVNSGG